MAPTSASISKTNNKTVISANSMSLDRMVTVYYNSFSIVRNRGARPGSVDFHGGRRYTRRIPR